MTTNNVVGNPTGVALIRTARYFPLKATCSSTSNGEEKKTCVSPTAEPAEHLSIVPSSAFARDSTIFREGTSLHVPCKNRTLALRPSIANVPPSRSTIFSRRDHDEPRR